MMSSMKRSIETIDHDVLHDDKRSRHSTSDDANQQLRFDFVVEKEEEEEEKTNSNNIENLDRLITKLLPLKEELHQIKSELSNKNIAEWNKHTAYLNSASLIVSHLREKLNVEIGTQAWAKMYEILVEFQLITSIDHEQLISLHLCEAPGAFISALNHYLTTQNRTKLIDWRWFGQTLNPYYEHDQSTSTMLIDDDRLIFHTIDDDHWDFGADNSGNLIDQRNIEHYISRFQTMKIDLITADGSFDMLDNPGEQERRVYPLLKSEIVVALSCLSSHGNFVMKLFTIYEQQTIQLIFILYRTFRKISIFKPTTSKRGNSEVYVVCRDFQRSVWIDEFSSMNFDSSCSNYSSIFVDQLFECCRIFQMSQIRTIESNLQSYKFRHYDRRFRKSLQRLKSETLNRFLDRCQISALFPTDRHLLKNDVFSSNFLRFSTSRTRCGTFNDQKMDLTNENLRTMSIDPLFDEIVRNPSSLPSFISIGTIKAEKPVKIELIFGRKVSKIENSPFVQRFLLKLFNELPSIDVQNEFFLSNSTSMKLDEEIFQRLRILTNDVQLELHEHQGFYYCRSSVFLTRLQLSVLYILLRVFEQAQIFVIPDRIRPFVLIQFQLGENVQFDEFERVLSLLVQLSNRSNLLQFVHLHQLFDPSFVDNLIRSNNLCLQLTCITSTMYSVQSK